MVMVSSFYRCLCICFCLGIISVPCSLFVPVVHALSISVAPGIQLRTSPLIGGPSWLPVHVKMIIFEPTKNDKVATESFSNDALFKDKEQEYRFDYVPLNPTSPDTLQQLLLLQPVPADARSSSTTSIPETTDTTTRRRVQRAIEFCEAYDKDLHLLSNNCWTFVFELMDYVQRDDGIPPTENE